MLETWAFRGHTCRGAFTSLGKAWQHPNNGKGPGKPHSASNNQAAPCRLRMGERVASILSFSQGTAGAQGCPRAESLVTLQLMHSRRTVSVCIYRARRALQVVRG